MWDLTPGKCARLPREKADAVVATVNSYAGLRAPSADQRLLATLKRHYRTVYLWIQTHTDYDYARSLQDGLVFINPSVRALDAVLASELDVDYVGNRLHAGLRALQHGRRAIIVEIDNRAREMGADFGLPTVGRTEFQRLEQMILAPLDISVRTPDAAINQWRNQFRAAD
jgi:polysaccharide pyruvyl transferase WcaK-like protein